MEKRDSNQNSPWLSLWIHPRQTMRRIFDTNLCSYVIPITMIGGAIGALSTVSAFWITYPQREIFKHPLFVIIALLVGSLLGLFHLYFGGWLYNVVGRWLKGKGDFSSVKCAVGWSAYPFAIASLLSLLQNLTVERPIISGLIAIVYLVVTLWALIISLYLLAESHLFSVWRALGTILVSFIMIFVFFMFIAFLIPLLKPIFD